MRYTIAFFAPLAGLACGCGTVCNLASKDPQPYGGVARSLAVGAAIASNSGSTNGKAFLVYLAFWGAEVSASLVGDTVCLPFLTYGNDQLPPPEQPLAELLAEPQFSRGTVADAKEQPWEEDLHCDWSQTPTGALTTPPTEEPPELADSEGPDAFPADPFGAKNHPERSDAETWATLCKPVAPGDARAVSDRGPWQCEVLQPPSLPSPPSD